jgi:hypothetical protein
MAKSENNREFTRSATSIPVEIMLACGVLIQGQAHDVSMNGLRLTCTKLPPVGTQCGATLILDGGAGQIRIKTQGVVTRADDTGMALEFTEIDEDGLEHLRNLVLYNSPDTDKSEGEIHGHVGMKRAGG